LTVLGAVLSESRLGSWGFSSPTKAASPYKRPTWQEEDEEPSSALSQAEYGNRQTLARGYTPEKSRRGRGRTAAELSNWSNSQRSGARSQSRNSGRSQSRNSGAGSASPDRSPAPHSPRGGVAREKRPKRGDLTARERAIIEIFYAAGGDEDGMLRTEYLGTLGSEGVAYLGSLSDEAEKEAVEEGGFVSYMDTALPKEEEAFKAAAIRLESRAEEGRKTRELRWRSTREQKLREVFNCFDFNGAGNIELTKLLPPCFTWGRDLDEMSTWGVDEMSRLVKRLQKA